MKSQSNHKQDISRPLNVNIFILSASVFGLLVICSPVISTLLIGVELATVYSGPLIGFAIATTIFLIPKKLKLRASPFAFCISIFLSIIFLFFSLVKIQMHSDQLILSQAKIMNANLIENFSELGFGNYRNQALFSLAVPFLVYGLMIMSAIEKSSAISVYKFEMFGAFFGTILSAILLELFGLEASLWFVLMLPFIAAYNLKKSFIVRIIIVVTSAATSYLIFFHGDLLKPERNTHIIIRDFKQKHKIIRTEESWTTFAKVRTVFAESEYRKYSMVTIGDGTGIAELRLKEIKAQSNIFTKAIAALHPDAQSIAVLFAGAGAELIDLNVLYKGRAWLTGIELNSKVIDQALHHPESEFATLHKSKIKLIQGEARNFLDTDQSKYDAIIYSWSGATVAHYSGAILHTTQYAFTFEALKSAVQKINENGFLIIGGGSKINLLLLLKELENQKVIKDPLDKSTALLARKSDNPDSWKSSWDNMVLIWKKGVMSPGEINSLQNAPITGYRIAVSPQKNSLPIISDIFAAGDIKSVLPSLRDKYKFYFDIFTDDRPFTYNHRPPSKPNKIDFWLPTLNNIKSNKILHDPLGLFLLMSICVIMILFGLFKSDFSYSNVSAAALGWLCGWIGVSIQILVLFRMLLRIENPTLVLVIGIGSNFLGSFIGSLIQTRYQYRYWPLIYLISSGLFICFFNVFSLEIFLISFLCVSVLWGSFFPAVLNIYGKSPTLVMKIWSLDAWGAACATLAMPAVLAQVGFLYCQKLVLIMLSVIFCCYIQQIYWRKI